MNTLTITLPPELTDYTIDFLHQDVQALRACALTCRSWLPSSRYHLFHNITLTDPHNLDLFATLTSSPSVIDGSSVNAYISTLTLHKSYNTSSTSSWETSPLLLSSIPSRLPNLRTLRLSNFLSFWIPSSFKLSSYASFETVENIELVGCSLKGFTDFRKLIEAESDLRNLTLDASTFGVEQIVDSAIDSGSADTTTIDEHQTIFSQPTPYPTPPGTRPGSPPLLSPSCSYPTGPALTSLNIVHNQRPLNVLYNYLLSTPSKYTLKEVKVDRLGEDEGHVEGLNAFLKGLRGLERLALGASGVSDLKLDLSMSTSLTHLTLNSLSPTSSHANTWVLPFLTTLTTLPHPLSIRKVTFEFGSPPSKPTSSFLTATFKSPADVPVYAKDSLEWSRVCTVLARLSSVQETVVKGATL